MVWLRLEADSLRQKGGESAETRRLSEELEAKEEELRQESALVVVFRQEREQAWIIATAAQEKVELLERELTRTQTEAVALRTQKEQSLETQGLQTAALTSKDREIERLLDQVAGLQRALRETELNAEQRVRAEEQVSKALRDDLRVKEECLREFEARFGNDGWGDVPITIYGLSPKNQLVNRARGQPPMRRVTVRIHLGHQKRVYRFEADTGHTVAQFNHDLERAFGQRARDYRLLFFQAVCHDQFPRDMAIGNFIPHEEVIDAYWAPIHNHAVPLKDPQEVQHYPGTLGRYYGYHEGAEPFPPPTAPSLRRPVVDKAINVDLMAYGPLFVGPPDSPIHNPDLPHRTFDRRNKRRRNASPALDEWPVVEVEDWSEPGPSGLQGAVGGVDEDVLASGGGGEEEPKATLEIIDTSSED